MIKKKNIFVTIIVAIISVASFAVMTPAARAVSASPTASVRSFPAQNQAGSNFSLNESTSVDVSGNSNWGGVESLNIAQVESPAQIQARQQAEQQAAASRSQVRQNTNSNTSQTTSSAAVAAPSGKDGNAIAAYAMQFAGRPYVSGGSTPAGWDCSGFTMYVYAQFGIQLPHQSEAQKALGKPVSNPEPGDLMWHYGHVGIYLGNGMMIDAESPERGTVYRPIWGSFEFFRLQ